ncbi:hypothetical protein ABFA07_008423 [Porites harrisoni]
MAPSSIHLKRQLLLYRNNCKGRFACLQYASNNRCFSVASTDLRMSVGMWLFCCLLLKVCAWLCTKPWSWIGTSGTIL